MTRGSAPDPPPPSRTDVLWTMQKDDRRLSAELHRVAGAWQLRVLADQILLLWYTAPTREAARQFAELIRQDCLDDGWLSESRD